METGLYTYYGDNRTPGRVINKTTRGGNRLLEDVFGGIHDSPARREEVPPFFVFEKTGDGRDMEFLGLAVPGAPALQATEDLVAVWRTTGGNRFQNYRAVFTVLDVPVVPRDWIEACKAGEFHGSDTPEEFRRWAEQGVYTALTAPRTLSYRDKDEQLPELRSEFGLLTRIHKRFADDPHGFEGCAAELWRMEQGTAVASIGLTRPSVDGGRDAIGVLAVGPASDPIHLDFALEAKCYSPCKTSVGVKDVARLISRLRHRQFGVLVTTSHVGAQAYKELREDGHPVVVMSGSDIIRTLRRHGISTTAALDEWLEQDFRARFDQI